MKKSTLFYIAFSALLACATLAISCLKGDDAEPMPSAGLTMINAFIESAPEGVLYEIDGRPVPSEFYPLAYRSYGYVNLFIGNSRELAVYAARNQTRLVDTTFAAQDSVFYSSIVYGTADNPLHFMTEDHVPDGAADPNTIAGARFFNLANTSHRVTLRIGNTDPIPAFQDRPTETPQSGEEGEAFVPVPTGTYELAVEDEDGEILATRGDIALEEGSYTSIFLTGADSIEGSYYIGVLRQPVN